MAGLLMIVFIFTKKNKALLNKRKDTHLEGKVNFGLIFFFMLQNFLWCKQPLLFFPLGPKVIVF